MSAENERQRAAHIESCRSRFARAQSEHERAASVLEEMDVLLEDAWARAVANSALSPAVLGAMVRAERLAFEHLRDALAVDPRWDNGARALIDSLTDAQVAELDAQIGPSERQRVRTAMAWSERVPPAPPDYTESLPGGWSAIEVMFAREPLADAALAVLDSALANEEPTALDLSEQLSMLCALRAKDARPAILEDVIERFERTIETQPDEAQRAMDLSASAAQLARAYLTMGEIARAYAVIDRLRALDESLREAEFDVDLEGIERWVWREFLGRVTPEQRLEIERRMRRTLTREHPLDEWFFLRKHCAFVDDELDGSVDAALDRALSDGQTKEQLELALGTIAFNAALLPTERLDALAELAAKREPRPTPEGVYARLHCALAARGSKVAVDFIERTARQRTVEWWSDVARFGQLPRPLLDVVLDGSLSAHGISWPVPTADALRWVGAELSSSAASMVDRLVRGAPIEQQAQRALGAVGRMLERGVRWLRDGGARDTEADRVAAEIARGELAASPAFDRVWWELGETAQHHAWLARPSRADRRGAIVNARVIDSIAGAAAGAEYLSKIERWLSAVHRAAGRGK
ncbi:MAG: hypothetical protein U0269_18990 [Polyangiales bacterium]